MYVGGTSLHISEGKFLYILEETFYVFLKEISIMYVGGNSLCISKGIFYTFWKKFSANF